MAMRATSTGTITFGLVAVPVKFYLAASSEQVRFNMLTADGHRVKQRLVDAETEVEVKREECNSGYEYMKGQYVVFTADELKSLQESAGDKTIDIKEFVDATSFDFVQVEKSYYLGPDKGGDKGYRLLSLTMKKLGKVAVGQWTTKGKVQLVVIRPYGDGLIAHQMYYANEVRDFSEIEAAKLEMHDAELDMAAMLVEKLSTGTFDPSKYEDAYTKRVRDAVEAKAQNQEIATVAEAPKTQILDLFAALKASLEPGKTTEPAPEPEPTKPAPKKARKTSKAKAKKS